MLDPETQNYLFEWDGKDAYGRFLSGKQPVTVKTGYVYPGLYATSSRRPGGATDGSVSEGITQSMNGSREKRPYFASS